MPSITDLGNPNLVWTADPLATIPALRCSTSCPVMEKSCWPSFDWAMRDKDFYRVILRYYRVMDTGVRGVDSTGLVHAEGNGSGVV